MKDGESFLDWFSRVCEQEISSRDDRNYVANEAQAEKFEEVLNFIELEVKRQGGKLDSVNLIPREEDADITALFPKFTLDGDRVQEFCEILRGMSVFSMDSTIESEVRVDCTVPDVFVIRGFSPDVEICQPSEHEKNGLEDWEYDEWIARLSEYCKNFERIQREVNLEVNSQQMKRLAELVSFFESEADEQDFFVERIELSPYNGSATVTISFTVLDLYMRKIPAFCNAVRSATEISAYAPESGKVLLRCKLPGVLQKTPGTDP